MRLRESLEPREPGVSRLARPLLLERAARKHTASKTLPWGMAHRLSKNDVGSARTIALHLLSTHVPKRKDVAQSNGATIRLSERPSAHESSRHSARQRFRSPASFGPGAFP
jgi:hypothetical protein